MNMAWISTIAQGNSVNPDLFFYVMMIVELLILDWLIFTTVHTVPTAAAHKSHRQVKPVWGEITCFSYTASLLHSHAQ